MDELASIFFTCVDGFLLACSPALHWFIGDHTSLGAGNQWGLPHKHP
jgi:hypothetical protein